MARQYKPGLSYFQADTDKYSNMKIKRLKHIHGGIGIAVYDYLLHEIYRSDGYFLKLDENMIFDAAIYWNIEEKTIIEIIKFCLDVELWNKNIYTKHSILTSKNIQERYIWICNQAKKKYSIINSFALNSEVMPITSEVMPITSEVMPINSEVSTHTILYNTIEYNKIEKEKIKNTNEKFHAPELIIIKEYFRLNKSNNLEAEKYYNYYQSNGWMVGKGKMKDWHSAAKGWILRVNDFKNNKSSPEPFGRTYPKLNQQQ